MELRIAPPSSEGDVEAWVEILNRVSGDVFTVEEVSHALTTDRASFWALACADGVAAGNAVGRPSSIAGSRYAMVRVLPEHRGQGVGTALYAQVSEHARSVGATSLWGRVAEDDAASRAFVERRGFAEVGREYEVVLDVAGADVDGAAPAGIELVRFSDRPDLAEALHALDAEVSPDVPLHSDEHEPWTFERWHAEYLEGPGAVPQAVIAALAGDEVVGYTGLRRRGSVSPVAENMLTAVRREWRGRGIATALKRAQIAAAREVGIEQIFTTNDETNAAMRGVNARLGYEPLPPTLLVSGPLAPLSHS